MKVAALFILPIIIMSCGQDSAITSPDPTPVLSEMANVDNRLIPYFNSFVLAARDHGLSIDLASFDLTGTIEDLDQGSVAGQCTYGGFHPPEVVIDAAFWNRESSLYREYVVFHELGHCILNQGHREGCRANRTYSSLMRSGLGNCRDQYTAQTRAYYLDELFSAYTE